MRKETPEKLKCLGCKKLPGFMNGKEDMLKLTKIKSGKALRRRASE